MEDRDVESESEDVAETEELSGSDTAQPAHRKIYRHSLPDKRRKRSSKGNCRAMRNEAEKNRRNKLNSHIAELYQLLPIEHPPGKKLDKTSILRLSAAFLRNQLLAALVSGRDVKPAYLKHHDFTGWMLDDLDAILVMVTSSGKIMDVSDTVQRILGHTPISLCGKPLADITSPDDHEELRHQLTPDIPEDDLDIGEEDESTLAVVAPSTIAPVSDWTKQKRSFFCKLKRRTANRSDTDHYELVHFDGHLYVPTRARLNRTRTADSNNSNGSSSGGSCPGSPNSPNDFVFLVAVVRPCRDHSLQHRSLLETSKEEYITRHTMDGRIIYCDQRISLVSGYLPHEVIGLSAFTYMHGADVEYTIVALRQMFTKGEDYGSSCYRLKTKNNEFIYLKTFGYLEKDQRTNTVDSLLCINILVSEEEGTVAIKEMKTRFSPQFQLMDSPFRKVNSGVIIEEVTERPEPSVLEKQVKYLLNSYSEHSEPMSPVGSGGQATQQGPQAPPTPECALVTFVSKSLPPASTHVAQAGITNPPILHPGSGIGGQSPRTPHSPPGTLQPVHSPQKKEPRPVRVSVVCGPRNSVLSSPSSGSPLPSPTTTEPVRTSVISGVKRSCDPTPPRESPRVEDSPRKKKVRTRSRLETDPKEPASRLGSTPTPTLTPTPTQTPAGGVIEVENSSDLETIPAVPEAHAAMPGYQNGGWATQRLEEISFDEGIPFQNEPLDTFDEEQFMGTSDLVTIPESVGPFQLVPDTGADTQQSEESVQGLILQQYQLGTSLLAQGRHISDMSENLKQVPANAQHRQVLERKVVQLTVEHSRQERAYQELQRDTHNIPNFPMGAQ